ncbi:hypothetical protein E2C01_022609 [Portunus trituberculatus]|uniref:Uncharacterized protein n=1 Tax=Portunus trituberculatus TaxID=210409 RepID=A0A5B7E5T6_PORTR|nr:hypothetical protein [Portunus trituberculatus]
MKSQGLRNIKKFSFPQRTVDIWNGLSDETVTPEIKTQPKLISTSHPPPPPPPCLPDPSPPDKNSFSRIIVLMLNRSPVCSTPPQTVDSTEVSVYHMTSLTY